MTVPNAHHGIKVAKVVADGTDVVGISFNGLGVPVGSDLSPYYPVPEDRQTVSFQCQLGSETQLWAQPYVYWGVPNDGSPEHTDLVGTEAAGPAFAFGGGVTWTQVDFTLPVSSTQPTVWRPHLVVTVYDPATTPSVDSEILVPGDVYLDGVPTSFSAPSTHARSGTWSAYPTTFLTAQPLPAGTVVGDLLVVVAAGEGDHTITDPRVSTVVDTTNLTIAMGYATDLTDLTCHVGGVNFPIDQFAGVEILAVHGPGGGVAFDPAKIATTITGSHAALATIAGAGNGAILAVVSGVINGITLDWATYCPDYTDWGGEAHTTILGNFGYTANDSPPAQQGPTNTGVLAAVIGLKGSAIGLWASDPDDDTDTTSDTLVVTTALKETFGWLPASTLTGPGQIVLEARLAAKATEVVDTVAWTMNILYDNPGGGATAAHTEFQQVFTLPNDPTLTPVSVSIPLTDFGNVGISEAEIFERLTSTVTGVEGMRALGFSGHDLDAAPPSGETHTLVVYSARLVLSTTTSLAPASGTNVYIDCIYVPENGHEVADQPYLDGDQPIGLWEGTPRHATSLLIGSGYSPPPPISPETVIPDSLIVDE